ncbi:hypothetical protein [Pleomorphomonas koreensis]|uniref:hypothetical protein n=1 Tax=Pleomorphomonas koreensis TaxID=257440 RepID=UPI0012EC6D2C|nr:hypothetical protein [Pleomorphomonas koreensis]
MHMIGKLLNSVARAPDGAGGAGGGESGTQPATPGAEGAGAPPSVTPPAADGNPPADGGNPPAASPEGPYRPDGLAENLYGKSDRETIDNLAKAVKGYRDRDAKGGGVPDEAAGYIADVQNVPEKARGYFDALSSDPVFQKIADVAKENGVSKGAFGALLGAFLEGNVDAGMFDPLIDVAAERSALIPDHAKALPQVEQNAAIDKRMHDNIAWLDAMVQQGMPKEAADYAQLMMFDTAKGHQFVEFFRSRIEGGGIKPLGGGGGGGNADSRDSLRAEMELPKHTIGSREFDQASYNALMERYQKLGST